MIKRICLLIFVTLLGAMIAGCQKDKEGTDDVINHSKKEPSVNEVKEIHGMVENIERLNQFVENVQHQEKDQVRLTRYTIEGDPIFLDLAYDGSELKVTYDSTEDKFGSGEIETFICKSIQKQEANTETKYILEECPQLGEFLTISHDVDKVDFFAFALTFGTDKVDTKNQELIKDLHNGEIATIKDFQFSKEEMNQIYKLMIFSNFLEEKKLSKECNQKANEKYHLTVWINDAERQFEWSQCDSSDDGKEMTALIQNILTILKNNPTYQTLPK